jgi:curved DNA-binding protein CbpA
MLPCVEALGWSLLGSGGERNLLPKMDAFAELGVERCLEMDLVALQEQHDRLSREKHPDAGGAEGEFDRLRESFEVLRDPVRRVRHWLELHGAKPGVVVEGQALELFGVVGGLIERCDEVVRKKSEGRSALVKSLAEREGIGLLGEVEQLLAQIGDERRRLEGRFPEFDAQGREESLPEVVAVAGTLLFLARWEGQLRERWVRLGL